MSNGIATTTQIRVDVRALAASIAQHMNGWTLSDRETNEYHAVLAHESGPELSINVDHWKHRLHVHGSWPRDSRNGSYAPRSGAPRISVGVTRSPKSIAREIERRFVPALMPLWHAAEGQRRQMEERNEKAEALARRLRDIFGLSHPEPSRYDSGRDSVNVYARGATFEVRRYGSVTIELTTSSEDVVLRLAEVIRDLPMSDE